MNQNLSLGATGLLHVNVFDREFESLQGLDMDEEHFQVLARSFIENMQDTLNSHTEMFVSSLASYFRDCSVSGHRVVPQHGEGPSPWPQYSDELNRLNEKLEQARDHLECLKALIGLLRSVLKLSQAMNKD